MDGLPPLPPGAVLDSDPERMEALPPLPPGFVLDPISDGPSNAPALPPGFVLDKKGDDKSVAPSEPGFNPTGGAVGTVGNTLNIPEGFVFEGNINDAGYTTAPAGLSDEDIDRLTAKAPATAAPGNGAASEGVPESWSDDEIDKMTSPAPSIAGGLLRSAAQGATADFGDEIVGLVGGDDAKKSYRAKTDKFAEEHPVLDAVGKGAGAIGSTAGLMLVPGGQIPALGRLGIMGERALATIKSLFGATNAAKAIPGVDAAVSAGVRGVPFLGRAAEIAAGTNARRGGLAAMEYGATSRAGQYEGAPDIEGDGRDGFDSLVDDGMGRIGAAFDPSAMALDYATGTGFTKALNGLMPRVGNAIDETRTLIARARGEAGADAGPVAVAKRLRADRVTPQEMRDQVLPQYRGMSQDDVANIMERYGDLVASGADDMTARQTIAGELAQRGVNAGTAQRQVRAVVQRYQDRNAVPSQINELAAMAQGGGNASGDAVATHRQFEAGINMARDGSEASRVSEFMTGRQPQARGAISDALEDQLGDGNVGRMLDEYEMRRAASNEGYGPVIDAFDADPQAQQALQRAIDLSRLEIEARLGNRTDDMANAVRDQLEKFVNPETHLLPRGQPMQGGAGPMPTTQMQNLGQRGTMDMNAFIHQRRALTDAIEASKGEFGRDTAKTHDLRDLKGLLDRQVRGIGDDQSLPPETRQIFTDWSGANDSRARLEAMRRAYQEGSGLNITAKGGTSLMNMGMAMRRLDRMRPDEREMFARGVMSQIKGKIDTGGDFHDVAKIFTNTRMRNVLSRMMGQDRADNFYQLVRRASLATRSARADKTSPTARIRDEKEAEMVLSKLRNAVDFALSPGRRAIGGALDLADDIMFRRKNEAVMRVLGANTDQPQQVLRTLRNLERAMRYQDPTVMTPLVRNSGPFAAMPFIRMTTQSDEDTWH